MFKPIIVTVQEEIDCSADKAFALAMDLERAGVLARYGVQLIGAQIRAIDLAEDRLKFKEAMVAAGLAVPACTLPRRLRRRHL